jgi:hypothetical protein
VWKAVLLDPLEITLQPSAKHVTPNAQLARIRPQIVSHVQQGTTSSNCRTQQGTASLHVLSLTTRSQAIATNAHFRAKPVPRLRAASHASKAHFTTLFHRPAC